ncbi:response regulator transcription factor [Anaerococcus sp.]|uniref:response regulator transcription factor n=1 Tax=Anaerococcus sp. TaxID=1872515 RepID=UPI0027B8EF94|nr:response regulator transcription factor [Anaerococcus sp.]
MKILIIEDNVSLVDTLKDVLTSNNYKIDCLLSLEDIDDYIILNSYDLIILDLMLGKYNGFDFLKTVRDDIKTPIIILTAKNTKEDIMKGFGLGADDYITKPFDMDILLARIKARIGRLDQGVYYKNTKFDFDRFLISKETDNVQMTSTEACILKFLYENKGIFLNKGKILSNALSSFDTSERVVVSHIYNIRQKLLEINADDPIENKWKVGYRWKED